MSLARLKTTYDRTAERIRKYPARRRDKFHLEPVMFQSTENNTDSGKELKSVEREPEYKLLRMEWYVIGLGLTIETKFRKKLKIKRSE